MPESVPFSLSHRRTAGLTPETPTVAAELKKRGYKTAAIGKWHLGLAEKCRPNANGFDYFYGFLAGCIDYYSHIFYWGMNGRQNPVHDLWENDREVYADGEYFTDLISEKAVGYIAENSGADEPFLLYLGYNAPHYPMHAPKKYTERFAYLPWERGIMAAMISAVDDGVGNIINELKRRGIFDNTIIYFQSDNGPSRETRNFLDDTYNPYYGGTAGNFKGQKFSLFEGGIRVPALICWKDMIPSGQVISEPCIAADIFPTVLTVADGEKYPGESDGKDIMPILTGCKNFERGNIYWELGKQTAIRSGGYKLVINGQLSEGEPPQDPLFLSNLIDDPSESVNLASSMPELAAELKKDAEEWRARIESRWETIPQRIAEEAKNRSSDGIGNVIEIGPGIGALTFELVKKYDFVTAFEIDNDLKIIHEDIFASIKNLKIEYVDIMKIRLSEYISNNLAVKKADICANLPYYLTTPIVTSLIECKKHIGSVTVMVQKEVADRLCADEKDKNNYGAISLFIKYHCEAKKLFNVSPGNFIPQPKVISTVVNLKIREYPFINTKNEELLFKIIRASFEQRRKTLANSLKAAFSDIEKYKITDIIKKVTDNENIRGEELSLAKFGSVCDEFVMNQIF
ncbi:arylsulfatase family member [Holotrichia oblita]|nr:arylsulfatase family member [Holotrichia oblita]